MARPPWLPATLATGIRDFVADFAAVFPRLLPRRYTRKGAQIYKEFQALGESAAYWRELLEWFTKTFLPHLDVEAMWLSRHERDYGIDDGGLTDDDITRRKNGILAAMRNRGTATGPAPQFAFTTLAPGRVRTIVAAAFPGLPPARIQFSHARSLLTPDYSGLNPSEIDWHKAVDAYSVYVYDDLEAIAPDQTKLQPLLSKLSQSGERWFGGRFSMLLFTTQGAGFGAPFDEP